MTARRDSGFHCAACIGMASCTDCAERERESLEHAEAMFAPDPYTPPLTDDELEQVERFYDEPLLMRLIATVRALQADHARLRDVVDGLNQSLASDVDPAFLEQRR